MYFSEKCGTFFQQYIKMDHWRHQNYKNHHLKDI